MSKAVLKADLRDKVGKGSSRALRREDRIPAVIYGNKKEPVSITISRVDLVKALQKGGFLNTTFTLEAGKKKETVLPRDIQFHPVSDWPMHVDFLRLDENSTIKIMIPVHFINEEECPGLKQGGILNVVRHEVEFNCPANAIPESITVDLATAELNESIHISAVALPENVTAVIDDRDFTVATIAAPSALKSSDTEDEAAEAGEETASEETSE